MGAAPTSTRYDSHICFSLANLLLLLQFDSALDHSFTLSESLTEMSELINTAGLTAVHTVTQNLPSPNPRTYLNSGKLVTLKEELGRRDVKTVIFDAELSPRQQKVRQKYRT